MHARVYSKVGKGVLLNGVLIEREREGLYIHIATHHVGLNEF